MTAHEALALLEKRLARESDDIPEGWYTTQQLADAQGVSIQAAASKLLTAWRRGHAERRRYHTGPGKPIWHYKVKP